MTASMQPDRETPAWPYALAVMALSALACFAFVTRYPLWNDEAFSFFVSWRGVAETIRLVKLDTQPPVYYLALTAWLHLGHSPLVLRALSAVSIVAATGLLYGAGRRLFGPRIGLLAAILFALDGVVVELSQRARPYALQTALAALMLWGLARIWTRPRPGWAAWAAYCGGGGLAIITQYPVGFMLLGINAAMLLRLLAGRFRDRALFLRWTLAQLALAAIACLWLPAFLGQMSADLTPAAIDARHSIYLVSAAAVIDGLTRLMSVSALYSLRTPAMALFGLTALLGAVALLRRRDGLTVFCTLAVVLAVWILGWRFVHPIFGYVALASVWFVLPWSLLLAAGVASLPRWPGAALMVALCGLDLLGLANFYRSPTIPLDQAAALLAPQIGPSDGILFGNQIGARWGLAYYLGPPYAGRLRGLDVLDLTNFTHAPDPGQKVAWLIQGPADTEGLDRLWVLTPSGESPLVDPAAALPGSRETYRATVPGLILRRFDR